MKPPILAHITQGDLLRNNWSLISCGKNRGNCIASQYLKTHDPTLYRLSLPKALWMFCVTGSEKVSLIVLTILETVSPTQMLTDSFPLFRVCIKFLGALCRTEARAHKAYFHFQAVPCPLLDDHLQTFFRTRLFELLQIASIELSSISSHKFQAFKLSV